MDVDGSLEAFGCVSFVHWEVEKLGCSKVCVLRWVQLFIVPGGFSRGAGRSRKATESNRDSM